MPAFITPGMTDDYILKVLGKQFRQMRINAGLDQASLAKASGLSRKTISSLEAGKSTSTSSVIAYLRGLDQLDALDSLQTSATISPVAVVKAGKVPQRIHVKKNNKKEL